jgi:PAS domain-containing protein
MYNYLTFLDDLQVTLNMFKSLPTCCIVFNGNGELIDINKPASDLLKIKDVECYTKRKQTLEICTLYSSIIQDILNGKAINNKVFEFRCADNSLVYVNLKVSLFCEFKDVFIFQFTQITCV